MATVPQLFDGQFRSKPRVSLRGASRQEEHSKILLDRAHQQREKRERERKRVQAAVYIQSVYRGHVVRQHTYGMLRGRFDIMERDSCSAVLTSTRLLLLFHTHRQDQQRMISLGQCWLRMRGLLVMEVSSDQEALYCLQRLLVLFCESLSRTPLQPLATPLRLIEEFAASSNYPHEHQKRITTSIYGHLLRNGYYHCLRRVLETRVPPPDELVSSPAPLAASLLQYCVVPLSSPSTFSHALPLLLRELLGPPLTAHICHLVLPALSHHLNVEEVISCSANLVSTGNLPESLELAYCVLELACHHTRGHLSSASVIQLLQLLVVVLSHVPSSVVVDDDEEEEEQDDNLDPLASPASLLSYILRLVVDGPLTGTLVSQSVSSALVVKLASLCCQLMACQAVHPQRAPLFCSLALSSLFLQQLWQSISGLKLQRVFGAPVSCLDQFCHGVPLPTTEAATLLQLLSTFSVLLSISLSALHDAELRDHSPFPPKQLGTIALQLRDVFIMLHTTKSSPSPSQSSLLSEWQLLKVHLKVLLCQLYDRNSRMELCPPERWATLSLARVPTELFLVNEEEEELRPPLVTHMIEKQAELLRVTPFVFPFKERVAFFHRLVAHDMKMAQGGLQEFMLGPALHVTARRNHLYEDAFSELASEDLRKKLRVNLVNAQGLDEAGIDGGGVFREFLSETLKMGLDPNRGFFVSTGEEMLYPNPNVHLISDSFEMHYKFLGALLGKALYEQLMVELPFAPFFLRKLTTSGRGWVETHHLSSLDGEVYHRLLWLKQYEGSIEELQLDFTTTTNQLGQSKVVPLKPGGEAIPVTRANMIEYIHRLAHHRLNTQLDAQFQAFRQGLHSVIPVQWLTLFNQHELQVLISGAEVPIDLEDLRANTKYSGEYTPEHPCIQLFWEVVLQFSEQQRRQLLKFVTSCSRPPLLGFGELHPPFGILSAKNTDYLPSASTCMHLLKLPMFQEKEVMRDKLSYAISSGAGFELS